MPIWIVDDGPLDHIARVVPIAQMGTWPKDELVIADATAAAASGPRKEMLDDASSPIRSFSVMTGSPAFELLYTHLREPTATSKNLAEHQAIAWALAESPGAIFVANDKGAAFLALAELGRGGAAHPTELWLQLRERSLITPNQFVSLCEQTRRSDQSVKTPRRCNS